MSDAERVPIACLPMYDWAEVCTATDALWAAICDELKARGLRAPNSLSRGIVAESAWQSPDLILGQTCGLPFAAGHCSRSELIGVPDYGVPECAAGYYRSAVIVRGADSRKRLDEYSGAVCAINSSSSLSGCLALFRLVWDQMGDDRFFSKILTTGSHRGSVQAVAEGQADMAAIDYVSWRFSKTYEAAYGKLRVHSLTPAAPGLPYIAAPRFPADVIGSAVEAGLDRLAPVHRKALGIRGFVRLDRRAYDGIAHWLSATRNVAAAHDISLPPADSESGEPTL